MPAANPKQVTLQQFNKYQKQQLRITANITTVPAAAAPTSGHCGIPTKPIPTPRLHHHSQAPITNFTALVSEMHISQHHQVNLSTPTIPPGAGSSSNNGSGSGGSASPSKLQQSLHPLLPLQTTVIQSTIRL